MVIQKLVLAVALVHCFCWFDGETSFAEELRIPAFTAYMLPDAESAHISEQRGVTHWQDPSQSVNWYGKFEVTGQLAAKVEVSLPKDLQSRLRLTVDGQAREATGISKDSTTLFDFGSFEINSVGHKRIALESLNPADQPFGDVIALSLSGPAMEKAHFNLKERRNAASVHLSYQIPQGSEVEAFYCEVTAIDDPVATFYMACGWHRGYFGMQVNSESERRIIFSVWDSGEEAVDRSKVADSLRVTLVGKGDGVYSGDFGNEGTGGHSHLKYLWKTGERQRFVVTAEPIEESFTVFSGYWFHPEKKQWMLISSWKAPKEGGRLMGLHSFSENFGGGNGHLRRKALYGNQWFRTPDGAWKEVTVARFSHDPTGRGDRFDRFMGVENGEFFLSHGGFVDGFTKFGEEFSRQSLGEPPADIELPDPKAR